MFRKLAGHEEPKSVCRWIAEPSFFDGGLPSIACWRVLLLLFQFYSVKGSALSGYCRRVCCGAWDSGCLPLISLVSKDASFYGCVLPFGWRVSSVSYGASSSVRPLEDCRNGH